MALNMNDGTNPPTEFEQLQAAIREAAQKIARYEAGQDTTPRGEGVMHTPGQLWRQMLDAPEDQRLAILGAMVENSRTAHDCFMQDHQGIGRQLEEERELLSIAVFDAPTNDSTRQLHTAVRALRQIMVDGIAARTTSVELADGGEMLLEGLDFPEEKDVKAKIGEQLKTAGIDLQSICGYEWEGEPVPLHSLGLHDCSKVNPLHADAHECNCGQTLTHEDAERLATQ